MCCIAQQKDETQHICNGVQRSRISLGVSRKITGDGECWDYEMLGGSGKCCSALKLDRTENDRNWVRDTARKRQ